MATKTKTPCHTAILVAGLLSLPATTDALLAPQPMSLSFRSEPTPISTTKSATMSTTTRSTRPSSASASTSLDMSSFDRGWDNDNFLESLGSGGGNQTPEQTSEAIDRANDEYFRQSRYGRPPAMDDEIVAVSTPSHPNAPAATARYSDSLRRHRRQQQERAEAANAASMASVTDAAAETYEYSYNKNLGSSDPAAPPQQQQQQQPIAREEEGATSGARPLPPEAVAKIKASREDEREEASQGGSRFRELMDRAKQQERHRRTTVNPLLATTATPPSDIMTPEEIATLSIDEQARLYREFFYVRQQQQQPQQQQARPSLGSTASNYLEAGIGFDGRKIGRNKDADAISNASDVYFARLKRDSTTRNLARYRGDESTANEVFHDPSIAEIEAPVNPYLEDQRRRMMDVIETVPEEMLVFREFGDEADGDETGGASNPSGPPARASGISYRERMAKLKEERQAKKNSNNNNNNNNPSGGDPGTGTGTSNPYSY